MIELPAYIHFSKSPDLKIGELIRYFAPDQVVVLVDENTKLHCLPKLPALSGYPTIEIKSGEREKTLTTCTHIWAQLTELKLSRRSLLINLGGGVIGDMGGFVAATYKRGIRFINIPTTLLAQVDASMGGKLGIDFEGLKNHIGVFQDPDAVLLYDGFLKTLPSRQLQSGYAEVIKHGLIWDHAFWETTRTTKFPEMVEWDYVLRRSVEIKAEVVLQDPKEQGLRKILNFGHTLGHAVETWHLENGIELYHGEAVAIGMIMESDLSRQLGKLDQREFDQIVGFLISIYPPVETVPVVDELISLLSQDKKNIGDQIMFSLLETRGKCTYDIMVSHGAIKKSVEAYRSLFR